jgi:hypothetical protein
LCPVYWGEGKFKAYLTLDPTFTLEVKNWDQLSSWERRKSDFPLAETMCGQHANGSKLRCCKEKKQTTHHHWVNEPQESLHSDALSCSSHAMTWSLRVLWGIPVTYCVLCSSAESCSPVFLRACFSVAALASFHRPLEELAFCFTWHHMPYMCVAMCTCSESSFHIPIFQPYCWSLTYIWGHKPGDYGHRYW